VAQGLGQVHTEVLRAREKAVVRINSRARSTQLGLLRVLHREQPSNDVRWWQEGDAPGRRLDRDSSSAVLPILRPGPLRLMLNSGIDVAGPRGVK